MHRFPVETGSVVLSKMGRDSGRLFIVYQEIDADFVLITDGDTHPLEKLKKKRRSHLKPTGQVVSCPTGDLSQIKGISPEDTKAQRETKNAQVRKLLNELRSEETAEG